MSLADGVPILEGDPLAASRPDPHPDGNRWPTIGSASDFLLLFVVHAEAAEQVDGANWAASSAYERQRHMKGKLTRKEHSDLLRATRANMPPEQIARLQAAAAMSDDTINLDGPDAPEVLDWSNAVRGKFYRPKKVQKTLRVDADVLAYFEAQGPGHLTRMNRVLRASMLKGLRRRRDAAEKSEKRKEHAL